MLDFNAEKFLGDLKYLSNFTLHFLRNPIEGMKSAPNLDWGQVLLLQGSLSLFSGVLAGIVSQNIIFVVWGLLLFPLLALTISFLVSLSLHYLILFFFQKEFPVRQTFILLVLANIPFLVLRVLSPLFYTVDLVGFIIVGFLLVVGIVENYKLEKQKVIKLVFYFILFICLSWLAQYGYSLKQDWTRIS
ncbi:MAG: hypothetical protein KDD37_06820 [Bdellovibrionales bacterium]|nr:hypothetical protein [Bdellovibrionales bacterium]